MALRTRVSTICCSCARSAHDGRQRRGEIEVDLRLVDSGIRLHQHAEIFDELVYLHESCDRSAAHSRAGAGGG